MAKSKSFFGLRTGSTKTLTFQVLNGKQITKDRVEIVKNPRTQSQMAQRCLMATASAAYTAMRKIVNHSFQGYSYGQQNMSKFISENVFLLQNAVEIGATDYGYNPFRDRSFKPGAYMISKGTLTPTIYTIDAVCETPRIKLTLMDGLLPSNYTANDVAEMMGLSLGEMSTICLIYGSDDAGWNFGFVRIRFIKAGDEPINDERVFPEHFELESNIATPTVTPMANSLLLTIYENSIRNTWSVYFGAIYSRKSANGWLRSTSYITVTDGTELQPDYETALATYPKGTGYVLNGAIIPNGGRVEPTPTPVEPDIQSVSPTVPPSSRGPIEITMNTEIEQDALLGHLQVSYGESSAEGVFEILTDRPIWSLASPGGSPAYNVVVNGQQITIEDISGGRGPKIYSVEWQ